MNMLKGEAGERNASPVKIVSWILGSALGILGLLGLANYLLNPLTFQANALRDVANVFEKGSNFAIDDPNIDFRSLRREHLHLMQKRPDVVIFAGSRFEVASNATFPKESFYNAFGHNDYFEDLFAITALLEESGKLPKMLVLSVRHLTFKPIKERETDEWRRFAGEYRRMQEVLALPPAPFSATFPMSHYLSLFSIEYLKHGLTHATLKASIPYGATSRDSADDRDILHPDGSLTFSKKHVGSFSRESARAESTERAKNLGKRKATLPSEADAAAFHKLLMYLKSKGVQPVIALTPHHPTFWDGIVNENYGKTLQQLEAATKAIAAKADVALVGSFDPRKAGCSEDSFRDYIHLDEACLKTIFDQIPRRPAS
jgi:hypothetical protein